MATSAAVGTCSVTEDAGIIERMRLFGEYAGIAFQIKDDLFDFQKSNLVGKPTGNDLNEKKITLPLIFALNQGNATEKKTILNIVRKKTKTSADLRFVSQYIVSKGGFDYAEKVMQDYHRKAIDLLNEYPDSEYKRALTAFVGYITTRES